MKLMRTDILTSFSILFGLFALYFLVLRNKFLKFIKEHWLRRSTLWDKSHMLFYFLFWIMMIIGVADIRGPEEKIDIQVPDQNTVIIIDTSLSMLTEDIRPSRFEKALILARHFVKNTYNGQISIVLFSDIQKKYVPFTDDVDLLDSRLSALSDGHIAGGGSNLNQAIMESIGYLKEFSNDTPSGNLLILTDGEDHDPLPFDEAFDKVAVAIVGIGTLSGAAVPLRDEQKRFIGHKEIQGEKVISKLNEIGIKDLAKNFKTFQYWIATSYSLPTDEISQFFNRSYEKNLKEDSMTMRPVYSHYAIVAAVFFMFLSVVFFNMRTFKSLFGAILITAFTPLAQASDSVSDDSALIGKFKARNLARAEKIFLASELLEKNDFHNAQIIYDEVAVNSQKDSFENVYNYGISLLGNHEIERGLNVLRDLETKERAKGNIELVDKINRNVLHFLEQEMKQKEQKEKQEQQNKNEGKNKKQQSGNGKGEQNKGEGQNDQQGKEQQNTENEQDDAKNKALENAKKKQELTETMAEKQERERKRRMQIKIPGLLKQLLSEDKNLQKKMFNTINSQKHNLQGSKDW